MKIKNFYDIVVVGSGPAGGMTALTAAKNSASVLILERDREIGIPVRCAEGISLVSLSKFFEPDGKWISKYIEGAKLYAPNGESCVMVASAIGKGVILERRLFDSYICKLAAENGAEILTKADAYDLIKENGKICGVKFRHFNEERIVRTNLVIGADGPESRIGRLAGLETSLQISDIESSAQYVLADIKIEHQFSHFFFGNKIAPGGYAWVFPKGKNIANVGIGVRADKCNGKNAKEFLDEFISDKFPDAKMISFIAGCAPTGITLKKITADNIILVGDAARQVNPVSGGGLSNVLLAGKIAGEIAAEAVKKNNFSDKFLKKYHKIWMKEKGKQQKLLHKLKEIFFDFSDEELNDLTKRLNKIPKEKLTLFQLLKTAIKGYPALVRELIKAYII
ncbi:MAG: NAD(P)/FAD-dependent oxidoreductase [Candidatus Cloacimonetes bacterium]|nr:NAD(P)/FAD-dependent oxidoreductase [Candidatus Cloacimonadota bacterium]MBL7086360.1 NAD(P)/FAD-dependent oxidoreductase [Candidatus Cloacimonadota bacterium]